MPSSCRALSPETLHAGTRFISTALKTVSGKVSLDKDYTTSQPGGPWETYYAHRILDYFRPPGH
ncbi:MAG TPA: hypothetical protein VKV02_04700 [Acidobacteriaceae bacterium]|nr:hypothetical protein [Acidobacteriaceae bacterium]